MATSAHDLTASLLGLTRNQQQRVVNDPRLMSEYIRSGFKPKVVASLAKALAISAAEVMAIAGITPRTLQRRRQESERLTHIESDRLYRIAHVFVHAAETLGTEEKAQLWLEKENRALGGIRPIDLLDTESGEHEVQAILERIDYGVFS